VGNRRKVVSVSGDGGFGQYAMELTAAARYSMEITNVLLDNDELGNLLMAHPDVLDQP
jgi:pyruvate oxidase